MKEAKEGILNETILVMPFLGHGSGYITKVFLICIFFGNASKNSEASALRKIHYRDVLIFFYDLLFLLVWKADLSR